MDFAYKFINELEISYCTEHLGKQKWPNVTDKIGVQKFLELTLQFFSFNFTKNISKIIKTKIIIITNIVFVLTNKKKSTRKQLEPNLNVYKAKRNDKY